MDSDEDPSSPLLNHHNNEDNYSTYIRSSSWSGTYDLHAGEGEIIKKLQWYFKNPYEKYRDRGRKPFKLFLQIIKIILVTVQATLFAVDEFSLVGFETDNIETFRNIYLVDYDPSRGQHELYTRMQVYEHMFYAWKQYHSFHEIMIGSYESANHTVQPINFCKTTGTQYRKALDNRDGTESEVEDCYPLKRPDIPINETLIEDFIKDNHLPSSFDWILTMELKFSLFINYTVVHASNSPDCYKFDISVSFDNKDSDGIMYVSLESTTDFYLCRRTTGLHIYEHELMKKLRTVFDGIIIIICLISISLCLRSFHRHLTLCQDTTKFFKEYRHEEFTINDKLNFLSFWLVLIAASDISTIAGSILKITLDWLEYPELYTTCSLCFGLAVLFSWIGILRYLGFMKGYNTLLITLKTAFPTIIRFIMCVAIIYLGFTVCGWIVFGPYHVKFRDLSVTSECLFALINGDDMYATFSGMDDSDLLIWYFSKIYLYVFISLFIFVVLGLFIGIIADTYERIKDYGHPPKTRVELFMEGKEYKKQEIQHRHGTIICNHDCEDSDNGQSDNDDNQIQRSINS